MAIAVAQTMPDSGWVQTVTNGIVKYAAIQSTNASGVWNGTLPETGLIVHVTPRTTGEFVNQKSVTGTAISVNFKKFRPGGLSLNLGTLLSTSIFEDSSGVVQFDIVAVKPTA